MSYILEALRRAESERQRGQVPGLHDAGLGLAAAAPAQARRGVPGWWAAAVVLLVIAAAALWWWPQPVPPVMAQAPVAATPAPAATPAAVQAPLPVVVSAPPPAAVPAAPAAPTAAAPERPMRFSELPPDEQRQLPALVPSGSVWSEQASARFVILNGQITREGDTVAPGLVLERIQPKAAWLRWRGRLIEVPL
jgi:general secretion pathway protein B